MVGVGALAGQALKWGFSALKSGSVSGVINTKGFKASLGSQSSFTVNGQKPASGGMNQQTLLLIGGGIVALILLMK